MSAALPPPPLFQKVRMHHWNQHIDAARIAAIQYRSKFDNKAAIFYLEVIGASDTSLGKGVFMGPLARETDNALTAVVQAFQYVVFNLRDVIATADAAVEEVDAALTSILIYQVEIGNAKYKGYSLFE